MKRYLMLVFVLLPWVFNGFSQSINPLNPAVGALLVNDNAQTTGMGEIGTVATEFNYNAAYFQNPALLARNQKVLAGFGSYIPWMRGLIPNINLFHGAFIYSPDGINAFSTAIFYHSMGRVNVTTPGGTPIGDFRPQEFVLSTRYARAFSENLSIGLGYKNITSDMTPQNKANVHAADLGADYRFRRSIGEKNDVRYNFGAAILNVGQKISYGNNRFDFLPGVIKIGGLASLNINQENGNLVTLSIAYQAQKLLVPTSPYRERIPPHNIIAGRDPNVPLLEGIFGSFYDAPGEVMRDSDGNILLNPDGTAQIVKGSVLREELSEIIHQFGFESRLHDNDWGMAFAFRSGLFYEARAKGNRKYVTTGLGVQVNRIALDVAYLFPLVERHPLANTILASLSYQLIR